MQTHAKTNGYYRCALRETVEITGLNPKDLHIDENFKAEIKYLSGTKYVIKQPRCFLASI